MSSPTVTIDALDANGVRLLPSAAPEFAQALDPQRDRQIDVLAPYSVLIKNDTDKAIIAYSVRWYVTDLLGKPNAHEVTIFDFSTFESSSNLPPHTSRLVSVLSGFGSRGLRWDAGVDQINQLMALFMRQTSIVIRLEAVLFKDGSAIGPDGNDWVPRWKAYIDAERDVYTAARHAPPADIRAFLSKSVTAAFELARPMFQGEYRDDTHLLLAANRSGTYQQCYGLLRGYFATRLLTSLGEDGEESTMQSLKEIIDSKIYPSVHREEF